MRKITFLALHLGHGGVESAISNQANMLCDNYNVEIVSVYRLAAKPAFKLSAKVKITYLSNIKPNKAEFLLCLHNKQLIKAFSEGVKALKILFLRKHLIKKYIKKANSDVIISTRILFNKILGAKAKKGVIKIAQEHVYHNDNQKYITKLIKSLKKIDYFMPVSQNLANYYQAKIKPKTIYIRHALDFRIPTKINYLVTQNLISVGRLAKEKGFLDLIDIINIVKKQLPNITLKIFGDGLENNLIRKKITDLKLDSNVFLMGFKDRETINKSLIKSSLYVMTSFEESFGLVLIEAMAFGIPCLAFDSANGAKEIINGKNGLLIKNRDKEQMANKIVEILNSPKVMVEMSKAAYNQSKNYDYDIIKKEWHSFFKSIFKKDN